MTETEKTTKLMGKTPHGFGPHGQRYSSLMLEKRACVSAAKAKKVGDWPADADATANYYKKDEAKDDDDTKDDLK
jgi:hypothetical protein